MAQSYLNITFHRPQLNMLATVIVASLLLSIAVTPCCASANLLLNGNLEQFSGNLPSYWGLDTYGNPVAAGQDTGHDGLKCLKIDILQIPASWGVIFRQDYTVPIVEGKYYRLTFWVKSVGVTSGTAAMFQLSPWQDAVRRSATFSPDGTWTRKTVYFKGIRTASNIRFEIWFTQKGTVWLDDLELTEIDPGESANFISSAGVTNILRNSSFELGTAGWSTSGHHGLFGSLDSSTAFDGTYSLKMRFAPDSYPLKYIDWPWPSISPITDLKLGNLGWLVLGKDADITVSGYLKADVDGLKVRITLNTGEENNWQTYGQEFMVSRSWQRYSFTTRIPVDRAYLTISPNMQASGLTVAALWTDALQVERAASPTPYQQRRPLEVSLSTTRTGNLFYRGDSVSMKMICRNKSTQMLSNPMTLTVQDFYGKHVVNKNINATLYAGQTLSLNVATGLTNPGYYKACLTTGSGTAEEEKRYARFVIAYPYAASYSGQKGFLGINHPPVTDLHMQMLKDSGISYIRDWSLMWDAVEPSQDAFDWSVGDRMIDRCINNGFNVLECLSQPACRWSSTASQELKDNNTPNGEGEPIYRWYPPQNMSDYSDYVDKVTRHFSSRIKHWEILNEPYYKNLGDTPFTPALYMQFLTPAYNACKAADSTSIVIGGMSPPIWHSYSTQLFQSGALAYLDGVNIHPYYDDEKDNYDLQTAYDTFNGWMQAGGGRKPVWATEFAVWGDDDPDPSLMLDLWGYRIGDDTERRVAESLVRQCAVGIGNGTECMIYHSTQWPQTLNSESTPFDLLERDGVPRKAYAALNAMAWLLPPGTRTESHRVNTGDRCYLFSRGTNWTALVWTHETVPVSVEAHREALGLGATILDMMGNTIPEGTLQLSESPVYVTGSESAVKNGVQALGVNMGIPAHPGSPATGSISTSYITWTWSDNSTDETSFKAYSDAGTGPPVTLRASISSNTTSWKQNGLPANSQYSFQISAANSNGESPKTDAISAWTLPLPPVFGTSGNAAIYSTAGSGGTDKWFPMGEAITFSAVNGFGDGPSRAAYYGYLWNNSPFDPSNWASEHLWNTGALSVTPQQPGVLYLHLRACNQAGQANATAITLGPYQFGTTIGQAKSLADNGAVALFNKNVTAVFADCFYVEEPDRSSGIQVRVTGTGLNPGEIISVMGVVATSPETRERYIKDAVISHNISQ